MITERTIINALIILTALLIMPFAISSALMQFDFMPLAIAGGLFALMGAFFLFKDKLCCWPVLGAGLPGALNFLPLPLNMSQIFSIFLILYYITGYVLIRQKRIRLGMPRFFWPIMIILAIMLYHNHTLGLRVVGSEQMGQRPAFMMYLACLAYFCGINVGTPSVQFISKLPKYGFQVALIGTIPFVLTTVVPGLAPYLAVATSEVNVAAYNASQSDVVGDTAEAARLPILALFGMPLQIYLLSYYPIGTWFRPERWWILVLSAICAYCTVMTGFRNNLVTYGMFFVAATVCYYSWRAFLLPVAVGVVLLVLVTASANNIIPIPANKLPITAQRAMSFLPGDWDPEVKNDAEGSNHFRQSIIDVYMKEYASKSPFIGNGYDIDSPAFYNYVDLLQNGQEGVEQDYLQAKLFIEGKLFHTGWVSLYDAVGIVGFLATLALSGAMIFTVGQWVFEAKADRRSTLFPLYVWLFCGFTVSLFSFFAVFGDFSILFQGLLLYGIIVSHVADLREISDMPVNREQTEGSADLSRSGARYGYGYQSRY